MKRRGGVFVRVLVVVIGAGLVPLLLATAAIAYLVMRDKEAALVDGVVATADARRIALEHRVALARAELRTVSIASTRGELLAVPELVTGPIVAVRCVQNGDALVDAAVDAPTAERLRRAARTARPVEALGDGRVVVYERAGDVDAWALLELRSALPVPRGWSLRLVEMASERPIEGSVLARRETIGGEPVAIASAPTRDGLGVVVRAPIRPAREAAFGLARQVALWSSLAVVPLILLAVFLARAVTSPVRALASVVRETRARPVVLPALPDDEIGDLGAAIAAMSARLHADAEILHDVVDFSRRIARLREPSEILSALEDALARSFPGARWALEPAEEVAAEHTPRDDDTGNVPVAQLTSTSVRVALAGRGRSFGVVMGRGVDEASVPFIELLCRTATRALEHLGLQQTAIVNEKLAVLGRLSASVAHEMNNPLTFVSANLRALEDALDGELRAAATDAREGAERLGRIVQDLSSIAKGGARSTREVEDLVEVARMAVKIARARRAGASLRVEATEPIFAVCDRGRLEQALLNLVINAVDACGGRDRPDVRVLVTRAGAEAHIDVIDNGSGIPESARRHIFDAFFTTKGESGTGLGLYLSRSFVQSDGGDLRLEHTSEGGTTFRIVLPARPAQPMDDRALPSVDPSAATISEARTGQGPRILLLDDEPALLRGMQRWLSRRAIVTGTSDPFEALRLARDQPFDLVLCDLHMPAMLGTDFVSALRTQTPALGDRVVIMTGSTNRELQERVVRKPVQLADIEELLRDAS